MNPTCILFVKAAMVLNPLLQTSTEPKPYLSISMSQADMMRAQAQNIDSQDTAVKDFRTKLSDCLKASPEIK